MTTALSPFPATPANARVVIHRVRVEFGDCDPARIVWFPNFFRWIDAASRNFFMACGVPPWHETEKTMGVLGTPLVDTHSRFVKTASYGDILDIHTHIAEWRDKSFVQRYQIYRADELIMSCDEVRIFAAHREGASEGNNKGSAIRAVAIPPSIRSLCE